MPGIDTGASRPAVRPADEIIRFIRRSIPLLKEKQILAGFDGFIDTIVKPVREFGANGKHEYYNTIAEFGSFIAGHSHKSTSIQYEIQRKRPGGNMPHFVLALDALTLPVTAIGMLQNDTGGIDALFGKLGKRRYSYLPAGTATVMEFDDGKIFFSSADVAGVSNKEKVFPQIQQVFPQFQDAAASADLIAFLNWSELPFAQELWNDVFIHALDPAAADKTRFVFFDLCDTGAKNLSEIRTVLSLIKKTGKRRAAILSMNKNELLDVAGKISGQSLSVTESAEYLFGYLNIDELVVHQHTESIAISGKDGLVTEPCILNKNPKISTGAGDNFNAAYCVATLAGLPMAEKLRFANAYAGAYIAKGSSPNLESL